MLFSILVGAIIMMILDKKEDLKTLYALGLKYQNNYVEYSFCKGLWFQ
ncbi:hypothetical protein CCAN11_2090008 [Capnocytophaga canimorsus]|uniref:Uncharacterized protein n=1 Tax=Capnocytophaga canimorsus TaxID=28188 RepID=A0A0B7IHP7_9FLAO|nr:hypothetical protein CCAN11_2090008 [Capnocytophaga canimorsus]